MFGRKTDKRRAQIVALISEARDLYDTLRDCAHTAAEDPEHEKQLKDRAVQAVASRVHWQRMLREYDAGLSVELPGESSL